MPWRSLHSGGRLILTQRGNGRGGANGERSTAAFRSGARRFFSAGLYRTRFGGKLAAFFCSPACFVHLAAARNSHAVRGNILRNGGPCRDESAVSNSNRRDQSGVAADENFITDAGGVFVEAVVIAGDGSGANICLRADFRVAEIGEMHGL